MARESVFGAQGNMPGDRNFKKKLEGRQMMRWYFPSKYNYQDFRIDEYFEMQSERFDERETHPCIKTMEQMIEKVISRREELRSFFGALDEPTFLDSPSLQDLYGLFRLVYEDRALTFDPPEHFFREHTPLFGQRPPFRVVLGAEAVASAEGPADRELVALLNAVKERLSAEDALALEARVSRVPDAEALRALLLEMREHLGVAPNVMDATVGFEPRAADTRAPTDPTPNVVDTTAVFEPHEADVQELMAEEEVAVAAASPTPPPEWGLLGEWQIEGMKFPLVISRPEEGGLFLRHTTRRSLEVQGSATLQGEWFEGELKFVETDAPYTRVRMRVGDEPKSMRLSFLLDGESEWIDVATQLVAGPTLEEQQPVEVAEPAEESAKVPDATAAAPRETSVAPAAAAPLATLRSSGFTARGPLERQVLTGVVVRPEFGGSAGQRKKAKSKAEADLEELRRSDAATELAAFKLRAPAAEAQWTAAKTYLARRHRFIDPMFRRRRFKWLERQMASKNKEREVKFNSYFATHPDDHKVWPSNKGSVTVVFPSPYH